MKKKRVFCRYHCGVCHSHFSSLSAFEAHRAGKYDEGRYCVDPIDDERFGSKSEEGVCAMYRTKKTGITVWALTADLRRGSEFWKARAA